MGTEGRTVVVIDRLAASGAEATSPTGRTDSEGVDLGARILSRETLAVFLLAVGTYFAFALYILSLDVIFVDALARTSSAYSTILSRDPHLAAIGFIWLPLPALLQIPFVALLVALRGDVPLAGPMMSILSASATLAVLNYTITTAYVSRKPRWALLAIYGLNPMVVLYAANGMSESLFILSIVLSVTAFIRWANANSLRTPSFTSLTFMSLGIALALLIRYEALALAFAFGFSIVLVLTARGRRQHIPITRTRIEAHLITFLAAPIYTFALWLFFQWLLLGDPAFFLNSIYSNESLTSLAIDSTGESALAIASGSVLGSLAFGSLRTIAIFPGYAILALIGVLVSLRLRRPILFAIVIMSLAVPVFATGWVFRGSSFGFLRFFMYSIPFAMLLIIGLRIEFHGLFVGRFRIGTWTLILSILLASDVATWFTMDDPILGAGERVVTQKILNPTGPSDLFSIEDSRTVAAYVAGRPPGESVLLENFTGFAIPLIQPDSQRYVVTSDRDFEDTMLSPFKRVAYVLVPEPVRAGALDRINREYPGLWERGAPWAELVKSFEDTELRWRLYRVIGSPGETLSTS